MNKVNFKTFGFIFVLTSLLLSSCKKDEVNPSDIITSDENELITTMELRFSGKGVLGQDTTFLITFNDPDGEGGNTAIQFDTINLLRNSNYLVELTLLDKSKSPADTISNEVVEKANDHLFFFTPNPISLLNVVITDKDLMNKSLGLKSTWTTSSPGSGVVYVKLMHQPGIKDGVSEIGSTDVEVGFQVNVK